MLEMILDGSEPIFTTADDDEAASDEAEEELVPEGAGRAWHRFVKERFRRSRFFGTTREGI